MVDLPHLHPSSSRRNTTNFRAVREGLATCYKGMAGVVEATWVTIDAPNKLRPVTRLLIVGP